MTENKPASEPTPAKKQPIDRLVENLPTEFEQQANEATPGLIAEFIDFLIHSKKWWLTPIIVVLLLIAVLIVLSSSVVAPFIYPFF